MIKLLILFLFMPVLSSAQKPLPRFENDTLYTTSGFRIYKGQTLQFGIGIRKRGAFKYINIKTDHSSSSLAGNNFIVNRLTNFGVSQLNNSYIEIKASITFRDGSKGGIDIHIAIDSAINSSELIVPEEDQFSTDSLIVSAQKNLPRFQNDTLFTTSGFKIFDGQVLQLGNASGKKGSFKYITLLAIPTNSSLTNTNIIVKRLSRFGVNDINGALIEMFASISFKDGSSGTINIRIAFDNAIAASELIVPEQYRQKPE